MSNVASGKARQVSVQEIKTTDVSFYRFFYCSRQNKLKIQKITCPVTNLNPIKTKLKIRTKTQLYKKLKTEKPRQ